MATKLEKPETPESSEYKSASESGVFQRLDLEDIKKSQEPKQPRVLSELKDDDHHSVTGIIPKEIIDQIIEGEDAKAKRDEDKLKKSDK
jgi:hypothetical protein